MTRRHHSGILSNTYVPPLRPSIIAKELTRLSSESLFNLVDLWFTLPVTQPTPSKRQRRTGITQIKLIQDYRKIVYNVRHAKSAPKRKLIDRILVDFYPNGLNALQLAQMDIQLMVDKPNLYSWVSSMAKIVSKVGPIDELKDSLDDFIFSLDSQSFLDHLIRNLANLYLTHIYISRHPQLPLIIIRIQMYEYVHLKRARRRNISGNLVNGDNPDIISRRPYYLAIPTSSPNLIHSVSNVDDLASKLILQSVETTLSCSIHQVKLVRNKEAPLKTLEAMHILKGVSRFGNTLGSWAPYADGTVDIGPLGRPVEHAILKPSNAGQYDQPSSEREERKAIAALRFKGSLNTELKSDKLFEDKMSSNKRQKKDISDKENEEDEEGDLDDTNEYASIVPIQTGEFYVQNSLKKKYNGEVRSNDPPNVRIRLFGADIFAGLHELAVEGVVDPRTMPSWLTGEEGLQHGIIKEGEFTSY
ncbi:DEKNAAC103314 [Brettanomyces naardenensis]|uniref:DEKNAAC103314 n=1 Tax=Brettanomyces naardenensis TaxID=13370 RepID=A0A448YNA6_BRENA|nr:DEKNAAC103314 [Brettanomyces naardenensis]